MKFINQESSSKPGKRVIGVESSESPGKLNPSFRTLIVDTESQANDMVHLLEQVHKVSRREKMLEIQKALNSA